MGMRKRRYGQAFPTGGVSKPYRRPRKVSRVTRTIVPRYGTIATERKVFDIDVASYQINTTGSITLLHIPVLGTDFTTRIGRKTLIRSIYIKGHVLQEQATSTAPQSSVGQQARFILLVDSQPNAAVPVIGDILKTADASAHLNLNNRDRFKVLKDKTFVFDPIYFSNVATQSFAAFNRTIANFKCYKKLYIETIFNGTNGGTIADITSGALYMVWIGSQPSNTVDSNARLSCRVRFTDQ